MIKRKLVKLDALPLDEGDDYRVLKAPEHLSQYDMCSPIFNGYRERSVIFGIFFVGTLILALSFAFIKISRSIDDDFSKIALAQADTLVRSDIGPPVLAVDRVGKLLVFCKRCRGEKTFRCTVPNQRRYLECTR